MTFISGICLHCKTPIDDTAVIWDDVDRRFICPCENETSAA